MEAASDKLVISNTKCSVVLDNRTHIFGGKLEDGRGFVMIQKSFDDDEQPVQTFLPISDCNEVWTLTIDEQDDKRFLVVVVSDNDDRLCLLQFDMSTDELRQSVSFNDIKYPAYAVACWNDEYLISTVHYPGGDEAQPWCPAIIRVDKAFKPIGMVMLPTISTDDIVVGGTVIEHIYPKSDRVYFGGYSKYDTDKTVAFVSLFEKDFSHTNTIVLSDPDYDELRIFELVFSDDQLGVVGCRVNKDKQYEIINNYFTLDLEEVSNK